MRALLLKYLFAWSSRQCEAQIRYNMVVKWFVGYPIFAAGPDHTTLNRFERWVDAHQHRTFFDTTLAQIDADFPQDRQQPQIGDTFAMQANAAREPFIRRLRHTCERLLTALAQTDPTGHEQVQAHLDKTALFGPEAERRWYHLTAAERQERLETTVRAALHCQEQIQATCPRPAPDLARWLALLDKVLADEVTIIIEETGAVAAVTRLPKAERGSYRMGSATDPEATYRVHGEDKVELGFNVGVVATRSFVREIQADTGAQPDVVALPELLAAQQKHHDCTPPKLIYDSAAGAGKTIAAVAEVSDGQTQLVSPLIPYEARHQRFGPQDFELSAEGAALTCPNGVTSHTAYRHGGNEGRTFRFYARQCQGCPLWEKCRDPNSKPEAMRQVYISDYYRLRHEAAQYNQTDAFREDMKLRAEIERIIACLVRYNDTRRAHSRGQRKADFQAKMGAMAFNIKSWMRLLDERKARKRVADPPPQGEVCLLPAG